MSGVEAALPVHDRACPPARPVEVRSGTPRSGDPNGQCETFSLRRSTVIVTSSRTPALPLAPQSRPPLIPWTESVEKRFQRSRPPWASIASFASSFMFGLLPEDGFFPCFAYPSDVLFHH